MSTTNSNPVPSNVPAAVPVKPEVKKKTITFKDLKVAAQSDATVIATPEEALIIKPRRKRKSLDTLADKAGEFLDEMTREEKKKAKAKAEADAAFAKRSTIYKALWYITPTGEQLVTAGGVVFGLSILAFYGAAAYVGVRKAVDYKAK
jgi:antitoxin component of MazEF toxin-antitoxin module